MTIWTMKIGVATPATPLTSCLASHTLYTQTQLVVSWCTHSGAKKRPKKVQFKQAIGTVFLRQYLVFFVTMPIIYGTILISYLLTVQFRLFGIILSSQMQHRGFLVCVHMYNTFNDFECIHTILKVKS